MSPDRAEVRNAADPEQVHRADRKTRRRAEQRDDLVRAQLATPNGRAFCWLLLEDAGLFDLTFYLNPAELAFQTGRRMAGVQLRKRLIDADPAAVLLMEHEARQRATRDARETDAGHTAPTRALEE